MNLTEFLSQPEKALRLLAPTNSRAYLASHFQQLHAKKKKKEDLEG